MEYISLNNTQTLDEYCEEISNESWLALDTEFIRESTYYPHLCLIQICTQNSIACIDALTVNNFNSLKKLLDNPNVIKIFHSASQDLEIFFNLFNELPQSIFDTQIAASVLGYGEQVSYAALVNDITGIELDKSLSRTAWDKRPLARKEIEYALNDVKYLAEIYHYLIKKLEQLDRSHWVNDELIELSNNNRYCIEFDSLWKSVKGAGKLNSQQLCVLKLLAGWREQQAMHENRPRKWILNDKALREIAIAQPVNKNELEQIEALTIQSYEPYVEVILKMVQEAKLVDENEWPEQKHVQPLSKEERKLVKAALSVVRERADEINVAPSFLATRSIVEKLVRGHTNTNLLNSWRKEQIGEELLQLVNEARLT